MIEAREVNFAYRRGEMVIHDISCRIEDGEFVALLGHNGSGKTTLSRLFMALDHPRSGEVLVDGEDIAKFEPADLADKVGYVFQNPDLQILENRVFDEVAYGLRCKKLSETSIKQSVEAALAAMGLSDLQEAYPRALSFGQKRRLGVAVALALSPKTLILDEITNGQDEQEKESMMTYLRRLNEEQKITIIVITHDMNIAQKYTKRALVLHQGDLVYNGPTSELFDGKKDVAVWGLSQPIIAKLGAAFGFRSENVEDFCAQLTVKAGAN